MEFTGKEKGFFKKEAHHLKPIFQIGKGGLTPEMLQQIQHALDKRELIKVSLLQNTMEEPEAAGEQIAQATGASLIQVIGHTLVLYKKAKHEKNRHITQKFLDFQKGQKG